MDGPTIPIDFGQQVETLVRCMYAYYIPIYSCALFAYFV